MALVLPRHYFYAVIVFAIFITASVSLISEFQSEKDAESYGGQKVDLMSDEDVTSFNRTFQIKDLVTNITDIRSSVAGTSPDDTDPDERDITLVGRFFSSAWNSVKLIIASFGFMDSAVEGTTSQLGFPGWLPGFIIALISVLLIFSILTVILGKDI